MIKNLESNRETIKEIIYNDPYLNKTDRQTLFYLIHLVEQQYLNQGVNYARVKQKTIEKKIKKSLSQIKRSVAKLKKLNFIQIKKVNKINLYYVNFKKFSLKSDLNRTSTVLEPYLKTPLKSSSTKTVSTPLNNYTNLSNSNKRQQQKQLAKKVSFPNEKSVVVSFELEEKIVKAGLSVNQVKHFISEGFLLEIIEKCLDVLLWIDKAKIKNLSGYFSNMIVKAHKNEWDFSSYDLSLVKQKERAKKQAAVEKKRLEAEQRERESNDQLERDWSSMSDNDKQKLLDKAKREWPLPSPSDFIIEMYAKSFLIESLNAACLYGV